VSPRDVVVRVLEMILVMWLVATAVFFVFRLLPGDPASALGGFDASPEAIAALRERLGLGRSVVVQYWDWLWNLLRGDLGVATTQGGVPVSDVLFPAAVRSFELALAGTIIAVLIALVLGSEAAARPDSLFDRCVRTFGVAAYAMPSFWLGILLLTIFGVNTRLLPIGGYVPIGEDVVEHFRRLALPAITVGIILSGIFIRFLRADMLDVLSHDYIRTARAIGTTSLRIKYRHALRNALIPFVTVVGVQFGLLIGGLVVLEQVFAWPGLGWLTIQAVQLRGYEVVQACVLVSACVVVLVNFIVDLVYAWLDPRITLRTGSG